MKGPMAAVAHEGEVAEARFAALDPVLEVMGVSPPGRAPAAWELAVASSQHQRLAQRRRDHPGRPEGPLPRLRRVLPRLRGGETCRRHRAHVSIIPYRRSYVQAFLTCSPVAQRGPVHC